MIVAHPSRAMARAMPFTPSLRATFASTCHPEKHTYARAARTRTNDQELPPYP